MLRLPKDGGTYWTTHKGLRIQISYTGYEYHVEATARFYYWGFMEPLKEFAANGKPMFGTCAGLILLAKRIGEANDVHLGLMDITVERNSFGRQVDSFEAELTVADSMTAVFMRAPHIVEAGENVEILAKYN